jgi:hypothetical protein
VACGRGSRFEVLGEVFDALRACGLDHYEKLLRPCGLRP